MRSWFNSGNIARKTVALLFDQLLLQGYLKLGASN